MALWLCLGFLAGCALGVRSAATVAPLVWPAAVALGAGLWLVGGARGLKLGLLAAAATVGFWRGGHFAPRPDCRSLATLVDGSERTYECRIAEDPQATGLYTRILCSLVRAGRAEARGEPILLVTQLNGAQLGDRLRFEAKLQAPGLQRGRFCGIAFPSAPELEPATGFLLPRALLAVRRSCVRNLKRVVPQPEAAFISSVLLGQDEELPRPVREELRQAGLLHVLVVSGFNLSLIAAAVAGTLRPWVGWRGVLILIVPLSALYVLMTGSEPPVVRAALMAALAAAAQAVGRPAHGPTILALAAASMVAADPPLVRNLSFQLSACTTAGLLATAPWLERCRRLPRPLGALFSPMLGSLGAQAAALPVLTNNFGLFPLAGIPASAFVLPAQGLQMLAAALSAATSAFLPEALARPLSYPAWAVARYTLLVGHVAASLPAAQLPVPKLSTATTAAYIGLLAIVMAPQRSRQLLRGLGNLLRRLAGRNWELLLASIGACLTWSIALQLPDGLLHVAFLDVGQGDAILITSPSGRRFLIDGGRDPALLAAHVGRALPYWQDTLDAVILTHYDLDHMGGLLGLATRYHVGTLIAPAGAPPTPWQAEWAAFSRRAGKSHLAVVGGLLHCSDGVWVEFLRPYDPLPAATSSSDNDLSIVARLTYGKATFLFSGDAQAAAEAELLNAGMLSHTWVLKVSHHGSASSTGEQFLAAVRPQLAIISVGPNKYGHPASDVLERLASVGATCLRTDLLGTIEVITDGKLYALNTGL